MKAKFVPERGEIVWLDFDPQAGHEQARRRPALVLSTQPFNRVTGFALVCPITSRVKGYPFEVVVPDGLRVHGVVLVDQVRSLDWQSRKAVLIGTVPSALVDEVVAMIEAILNPD